MLTSLKIRQSAKKKLTKLKKYITVPNTILLVGFISAFMYLFSYLFPFTDNAFVMNNFRPVAAQVTGYVTHVYVKNGATVTKGQKLFSVFKKPYFYMVEQLKADLEVAKANLNVLETTYERDEKLSENRQKIVIKLSQDDKKYMQGYKIKAVSQITLQNSQQDTQAAKDNWAAAMKQLEIDTHRIKAQTKEIKSITAKLNYAKVQLALTDVYSHGDGIIQNLFLLKGTPVTINQPLFSLVDTNDTYIQANFNETDLRNVRQGSRVYIYPRMYLGRKMFHGIVDSDYWAANRQAVDSRTQLQTVFNENEWILLPQRLPVIIKITDPDPHYPLRVGTSAYVYIKTTRMDR